MSSGYLQLRALDLNLDISRRTLDSRNESLQLAQVREAGGVTSLLDVRQAEQLVFGARAEIATLERQIAQQENFLSELLGNNPGPIPRGRPLIDQPRRPEVPAGLPSELLERRPDIQRAEQELIAANAQIGVARADYFPRIALTGSGGFESTALATLFTGSNIIWSAAASAVVPVVTAGRTKSHVALAEARREEATIAYQQTVRQAFREVSDALIGYRSCRSSVRSRRSSLPRPRTRAVSRRSDTRAARPAISRSSMRIRACLPRNSISPRRNCRNDRRWSKSTGRLAAAGRLERENIVANKRRIS